MDRLGLMLSGTAGHSVRPFKSIVSLDSHFPNLSARSSDGRSPGPSSVAERMMLVAISFDSRSSLRFCSSAVTPIAV